MDSKMGVDELSVEQDVRPCKHMEGMVSSLADGSLHGPARWYTQLHAMHCTQCNAAVKNLKVVIGRVKELGDSGAQLGATMPDDRRAELNRALDEIDVASRSKG